MINFNERNRVDTMPWNMALGMNDHEIIEQFHMRSESAISAIADKYAKYCYVIAYNVLGNKEDAEEVLNDSYNRVWNAIPPEKPNNLRAYIGKIVRNLSINRLEKQSASKRGSGQYFAVLSELEECIADKRNSVEELAESEAITDSINNFLSKQGVRNRRVFVKRYWKASSLDEIALDLNMSIGNVKTILFRMRNELRTHLESEGIYI